MKDLLGLLNSLRRPRLLIRAARFGAQDYVRDRHLRRLLGRETLPRPAAALTRLMELESSMNEQRLLEEDGYSLPRHLDLLIAMIGEARLYVATQSPETPERARIAAVS